MLRMEDFRFRAAGSWAEARAMWSPEAVYLAGGTDLLPNLKHRILHPRLLIGLGGLGRGIHEADGELVIGAGTPLQAVADDPRVRSRLPPLAAAAAAVAGPQIRRMGTLGGNVLLDTRCLYYNQTEFWRGALGHCLKAEGDWCHVVGGPKTCVATQSSDTVPVLLALGARLRLLGEGGERELPIRDLYQFNGMDHLRIARGELLTAIHVPLRRGQGSYDKLRTRDSIDFPQLGLALWVELDGDRLTDLQLVVGAVNPQPKPLRGSWVGRRLDAALVDEVAAQVHAQTRPQASVHGDVAWRRQMATVFARRALGRIVKGL